MQYFKKNDSGEYEEVKPAKVFETQDEMNEFVKEKTDQIKRNQFGDYDDIKAQLADANKKVTEVETSKKTLDEQLKSKDNEVQSATLKAARVTIRHEFGLKEDLDKFLIGETEEEIRANAELLKKNGGTGGVTIKKDTEKDPKESPSKSLAQGIFGPADE